MCGDYGRLEITGCPLRTVPASIWGLEQLADVYDKRGIPPRAGGVLDQSADFWQACQIIWSDDNAWRSRLSH